MRRLRFVVARWASLLCCGAVCAAMWVVLSAPTQALLQVISDHAASLRPGVLVSALVVLASAGLWHVGHRRWRAFLGVRHFGGYPPLWIAPVVALAILASKSVVLAGWGRLDEVQSIAWWSLAQVPALLWLLLGMAAVSECAISYYAGRLPPSRPRRVRGGSPFQELVEWIRDDIEIARPEDDRFGHDLVARHIVGRLTSGEGQAPTMAVVGPLGCGKSTIRGLVAHHLKAHSSIEFINLSLWPFDSAEAASAGILRSAIRALGSHVNTVAVSGLSEKYIAAIEKAGGRWGVLAPYLHGESRPEALLRELAVIATAAGVKLVLWIEDMERFTGADRLSPSEATIRESERLGPILSLLYLLDRSESVCVIVADTSLRSRLDVGKIARFVETPPRLSAAIVWKQIEVLRTACLAADYIDGATREFRERLAPPVREDSLTVWLSSIRDSEPRVQEAVAVLLGVPRTFKSALRVTWETWVALRGEIDFDSMLVASVLRVARPEVFSLIDEHIDKFRNGFRDPLAGAIVGASASMHPVLAQLEKMLELEPDDRTRNSVRALISFVFPAALDHSTADDSYIDCPQGLSVARHADYWQRYLTPQAIPEHGSDQAVLREIKDWKAGKASGLIERLAGASSAGQVESFVGQFTAADLCRLLEELAGALSVQSAADWQRGSHAPGITSIWRMMHRRRPPSGLLAETLKQVIRVGVAENLPLIQSVLSFFATDEGSRVPPLLDATDRHDFSLFAAESFEQAFPRGSGRKLVAAMKNGSPFAVAQICLRLTRNRANQTQGLPFDGWAGVSMVLLEAAELDPLHVVPLIVPFVTRSNVTFDLHERDASGAPGRGAYTAVFDEAQARALFDFDRLIKLLQSTERPPHLEAQIAVAFDAAREAALAFPIPE